MKLSKLFVVLPVTMLATCLTIGCGGSDEPTVLPAEDVTMTPEEEAVYEEQTMSSADDESQN